MSVALVVVPSVTKLPPETDGAVVVGGSHGAVYAAYMSAKSGCRAAIHHDAGIGQDEAGVSGLAWAAGTRHGDGRGRDRERAHRRRRRHAARAA